MQANPHSCIFTYNTCIVVLPCSFLIMHLKPFELINFITTATFHLLHFLVAAVTTRTQLLASISSISHFNPNSMILIAPTCICLLFQLQHSTATYQLQPFSSPWFLLSYSTICTYQISTRFFSYTTQTMAATNLEQARLRISLHITTTAAAASLAHITSFIHPISLQLQELNHSIMSFSSLQYQTKTYSHPSNLHFSWHLLKHPFLPVVQAQPST